MPDLIQRGKSGRDAIRRILRELEQYGYLDRAVTHNDDGTFSWEHRVYESPALNPNWRAGPPSPENPATDEPSTVEPSPGYPSPVNPSPYMKNKVPKTHGTKNTARAGNTHMTQNLCVWDPASRKKSACATPAT